MNTHLILRTSALAMVMTMTGCMNTPSNVFEPVTNITSDNTSTVSVSTGRGTTTTTTTSSDDGTQATNGSNTGNMISPDLPNNGPNNPLPTGSDDEERQDPL